MTNFNQIPIGLFVSNIDAGGGGCFHPSHYDFVCSNYLCMKYNKYIQNKVFPEN